MNLKIIKYWQVAWVAINENRGRSTLTMLGIIIGVGAVVLMTSLGKGAESLILGSVSDLGSDLVYIIPGSPEQGLSGSIISVDRIKYKDYLSLEKVDFLRDVTPFLVYDGVLVAGQNNEAGQVIGTNRNYLSAMNFYPENGRFIEDFDINNSSKVIVLGREIAQNLFGDQNPVGQDIKISGLTFKVIGVMEEQGGNAFENWDIMVFTPITTMQTYLFGVDFVQNIMAKANGDVDQSIEKTVDYVRRLHNIDNPENDYSKDDFNVMGQEQALGIITTVSSVLTLFIVLIASISLVVGGIGIMNIMYVSVNQRTREIGLRKAVGATNSDIMMQFLFESTVLTLIGGLVGAGFGLGIAFLLSLIIVKFQEGWEFLINWPALFIALQITFMVGIIFGIYPARKASKLDPIEALRYE